MGLSRDEFWGRFNMNVGAEPTTGAGGADLGPLSSSRTVSEPEEEGTYSSPVPQDYFREHLKSTVTDRYEVAPTGQAQVKTFNKENFPWMKGQLVTEPSAPGKVVKSTKADTTKEYRDAIRKRSIYSNYEIDHNIPVWAGGADTDENKILLPKYKHDQKTAVDVVARTLYRSQDPEKAISLNDARNLALNWSSFDTAELHRRYGDRLPESIDESVAAEMYRKWQEPEKVTFGDWMSEFGESLAVLPGVAHVMGLYKPWREKQQEVSKKVGVELAELAPDDLLGEMYKGFITGTTLGGIDTEDTKEQWVEDLPTAQRVGVNIAREGAKLVPELAIAGKYVIAPITGMLGSVKAVPAAVTAVEAGLSKVPGVKQALGAVKANPKLADFAASKYANWKRIVPGFAIFGQVTTPDFESVGERVGQLTSDMVLAAVPAAVGNRLGIKSFGNMGSIGAAAAASGAGNAMIAGLGGASPEEMFEIGVITGALHGHSAVGHGKASMKVFDVAQGQAEKTLRNLAARRYKMDSKGNPLYDPTRTEPLSNEDINALEKSVLAKIRNGQHPKSGVWDAAEKQAEIKRVKQAASILRMANLPATERLAAMEGEFWKLYPSVADMATAKSIGKEAAVNAAADAQARANDAEIMGTRKGAPLSETEASLLAKDIVTTGVSSEVSATAHKDVLDAFYVEGLYDESRVQKTGDRRGSQVKYEPGEKRAVAALNVTEEGAPFVEIFYVGNESGSPRGYSLGSVPTTERMERVDTGLKPTLRSKKQNATLITAEELIPVMKERGLNAVEVDIDTVGFSESTGQPFVRVKVRPEQLEGAEAISDAYTADFKNASMNAAEAIRSSGAVPVNRAPTVPEAFERLRQAGVDPGSAETAVRAISDVLGRSANPEDVIAVLNGVVGLKVDYLEAGNLMRVAKEMNLGTLFEYIRDQQKVGRIDKKNEVYKAVFAERSPFIRTMGDKALDKFMSVPLVDRRPPEAVLHPKEVTYRPPVQALPKGEVVEGGEQNVRKAKEAMDISNLEGLEAPTREQKTLLRKLIKEDPEYRAMNNTTLAARYQLMVDAMANGKPPENQGAYLEILRRVKANPQMADRMAEAMANPYETKEEILRGLVTDAKQATPSQPVVKESAVVREIPEEPAVTDIKEPAAVPEKPVVKTEKTKAKEVAETPVEEKAAAPEKVPMTEEDVDAAYDKYFEGLQETAFPEPPETNMTDAEIIASGRSEKVKAMVEEQAARKRAEVKAKAEEVAERPSETVTTAPEEKKLPGKKAAAVIKPSPEYVPPKVEGTPWSPIGKVFKARSAERKAKTGLEKHSDEKLSSMEEEINDRYSKKVAEIQKNAESEKEAARKESRKKYASLEKEYKDGKYTEDEFLGKGGFGIGGIGNKPFMEYLKKSADIEKSAERKITALNADRYSELSRVNKEMEARKPKTETVGTVSAQVVKVMTENLSKEISSVKQLGNEVARSITEIEESILRSEAKTKENKKEALDRALDENQDVVVEMVTNKLAEITGLERSVKDTSVSPTLQRYINDGTVGISSEGREIDPAITVTITPDRLLSLDKNNNLSALMDEIIALRGSTGKVIVDTSKVQDYPEELSRLFEDTVSPNENTIRVMLRDGLKAKAKKLLRESDYPLRYEAPAVPKEDSVSQEVPDAKKLRKDTGKLMKRELVNNIRNAKTPAQKASSYVMYKFMEDVLGRKYTGKKDKKTGKRPFTRIPFEDNPKTAYMTSMGLKNLSRILTGTPIKGVPSSTRQWSAVAEAMTKQWKPSDPSAEMPRSVKDLGNLLRMETEAESGKAGARERFNTELVNEAEYQDLVNRGLINEVEKTLGDFSRMGGKGTMKEMEETGMDWANLSRGELHDITRMEYGLWNSLAKELSGEALTAEEAAFDTLSLLRSMIKDYNSLAPKWNKIGFEPEMVDSLLKTFKGDKIPKKVQEEMDMIASEDTGIEAPKEFLKPIEEYGKKDEKEGKKPYSRLKQTVEEASGKGKSKNTSMRSTPEFDKLPVKNKAGKTMTYAGVGSRKAPPEILKEMSSIAEYLSDSGYTLNTGGVSWKGGASEGSDKAFRDGSRGKANVFSDRDATDTTRTIAKEIHPAPSALKPNALNLMARNTNQVFGKNLDAPVDFLVAWTEDGVSSSAERSDKSGGTGQAIDMASRKGIPVINLKNIYKKPGDGVRAVKKLLEGVGSSGKPDKTGYSKVRRTIEEASKK